MLLDSIDAAWTVGNMVFSATKATTTKLDMSQVNAMSYHQVLNNCNAAGSPANFAAKYGVSGPFSGLPAPAKASCQNLANFI